MSHSDPEGASFRQLQRRPHAGKPARVVVAERLYATDPADLWDALTTPERLARWFAPVSGDLTQGGRYQIEGNAGGRITHCAPPEALDLTWEIFGHTSWVTLRLAKAEGGTRLTLEHIAHVGDEGEAHWQTYGPGATGVGWDLAFHGLALHLAAPASAPDPAAQEAWAGTAPGKRFLRGLAEAWGAAHVAAGAAPERAGAMARRTGDFYTGA